MVELQRVSECIDDDFLSMELRGDDLLLLMGEVVAEDPFSEIRYVW